MQRKTCRNTSICPRGHPCPHFFCDVAPPNQNRDSAPVSAGSCFCRVRILQISSSFFLPLLRHFCATSGPLLRDRISYLLSVTDMLPQMTFVGLRRPVLAAMTSSPLSRGISGATRPLLAASEEPKSERVEELKKKISEGPGFADFVGGGGKKAAVAAATATAAGEERSFSFFPRNFAIVPRIHTSFHACMQREAPALAEDCHSCGFQLHHD